MESWGKEDWGRCEDGGALSRGIDVASWTCQGIAGPLYEVGLPRVQAIGICECNSNRSDLELVYI